MAFIKLSYLNPSLVIADHRRPSPGNSPLSVAKTLSRSTVSRVAYRLFSTCSRGAVTPVPLRAVINCRRSPPQGVNTAPIIPALFRLMKIQSDINTFSHPYYVRSLPEYPGLDYEHWVIVMKKKPGGENNANKQQMIDCYVQTLAKIVGSEEEAKRKMYNVSFEVKEGYYGFGCEIDEETSKKLEELPGVEYALPDVYLDPEYKDYGAELFVNGEVFPRSPERQSKIEELLRQSCLYRPYLYITEWENPILYEPR